MLAFFRRTDNFPNRREMKAEKIPDLLITVFPRPMSGNDRLIALTILA